jgi:hypothetical protein
MTLQMNKSGVLNYARSKLVHALDPASLFSEGKGLRESCDIPHKGCYLSVVDAKGIQIVREGFMTASADNILNSIDKCVETVVPTLKNLSFSTTQLTVSQVIITVVEECQYIADPLAWDANSDGIYFQWGDRYHAMYLPYQVKELNLTKTATLDRLVGWEAGLACNLWRTEAGLVFRLRCLTIN